MRKFLITSLLALGALAGSQQHASAWISCGFNIGLSWHWQSGDNCWLWGLYSNGPTPCLGYGGPGPYGVGYGYGYGYGYPTHGLIPPLPATPATPPTPLAHVPHHGGDPFYFLQWD